MHPDKQAAQKQWNANPCGTGEHLASLEYGSLAFFDEVARLRYNVSDTWIKETIDFSQAKGKRVLEIGHGMGTDLLSFRRAGAEVHGIDITQEHHRLAKENFRLHNEPCNLTLCDAAQIAYPDQSFDLVYSMGVIHSSPDTIRCISEAYRVLKPGGQFIAAVYYKYSAFHLFRVLLFNGILRGQLKRLGYRNLLSTVEYGADGIERAPLVKLYGKRHFSLLFGDFATVKMEIAHFKRDHIPFLGRLIPRSWERRLSRFWGWYVIAFATK